MANSYIYTSYRQQWLFQHGDRGENDVFRDQEGWEYVFMYKPGGETRVYLPKKAQRYPQDGYRQA